VAGVVILVLPDILAHGVSGNFLGAMAVLVAALSYAANAIYQRRKMRNVSVFDISIDSSRQRWSSPSPSPLRHCHMSTWP